VPLNGDEKKTQGNKHEYKTGPKPGKHMLQKNAWMWEPKRGNNKKNPKTGEKPTSEELLTKPGRFVLRGAKLGELKTTRGVHGKKKQGWENKVDEKDYQGEEKTLR